MPREKFENLPTDEKPLILLPDDPRAKDVKIVGGKASSLSELAEISAVPPFFLITTDAYDSFVNKNPHLRQLISSLDSVSTRWMDENIAGISPTLLMLETEITSRAAIIRSAIQDSEIPQMLVEGIELNYLGLSHKMGVENLPVAVRSSGVAEDTKDASFAGQYDTFLNQRGVEQVLNSVKEGFASQFTDRVVSYRNDARLEMLRNGNEQNGILSHSECKLALAVQAMVESQVSGVAFSIEPESASPFISIETSYGLGEAIVAGEVTPDSFLVDPQTGKIIQRTLGEKAIKTIYGREGGTHTIETSNEERDNFSLSDQKIMELATEISKIRTHYGNHVDVEFGLDKKGDLYVFQARPETVASHKNPLIVSMKRDAIAGDVEKEKVLLRAGKTGSPGVGVGRVVVAETVNDAKLNLKKGDVLVTERTDPDWNPVLHLPSAVVTNIGGANCHAAIISRERGIPCLVGTGDATIVLSDYIGQEVTVDAGSSTIYSGALPLESVGENISVNEILGSPTDIPIGLIVSNPETARKMHGLKDLENKFLISLLRIEFLLTDIGVHSRALEDYDRGKIEDPELKKKIEEKIKAYHSGKDYYVTRLAEGIAQFAAIFPNSPVTVRTTDFKTNEYGDLIGGKVYESKEANPMMGWRGLIRSLSPESREVTRWELQAIKEARDMGYKNIQIMFPVVRDPVELTGCPEFTEKGFKGIFEIMEEVGLKQGEDGLKVGIMVEVPTNVMRIDDFIDTGINFISFGTNDLTQFTLAVDRDGNESIQSIPIYREGNKAVVQMVEHVIKRCKERGVKTGICGQAPSNDPLFVEMLVKAGVNSIGVMPDRYLPTYRLVKAAEKVKKNEEISWKKRLGEIGTQ